jgi:hypothetical protein
MAGLSVGISAPGWDSTIRAMRALPRDLKAEVRTKGSQLAQPVAQEVKAAGKAQGSHAASVADTVKPSVRNGSPSIKAGGLPYSYGSEFGGGIRRTTYYSTSPLGKRYLVLGRHTTKQFRPHRTDGYWFFHTVLEGEGREIALRQWAELIDDLVGRF